MSTADIRLFSSTSNFSDRTFSSYLINLLLNINLIVSGLSLNSFSDSVPEVHISKHFHPPPPPSAKFARKPLSHQQQQNLIYKQKHNYYFRCYVPMICSVPMICYVPIRLYVLYQWYVMYWTNKILCTVSMRCYVLYQ